MCASYTLSSPFLYCEWIYIPSQPYATSGSPRKSLSQWLSSAGRNITTKYHPHCNTIGEGSTSMCRAYNKQEAARSHHFTAIHWCWSAVSHRPSRFGKNHSCEFSFLVLLLFGVVANLHRWSSYAQSLMLFASSIGTEKKYCFGHSREPLESTKANGCCRRILILDAAQARSSAIILRAQRPGVTAPKIDR